jgi:hypothetical protein
MASAGNAKSAHHQRQYVQHHGALAEVLPGGSCKVQLTSSKFVMNELLVTA